MPDTETKRRCEWTCVYGTRARCLLCDHFGPRPGPVRRPVWEREESLRIHPGSWRNTDRDRTAGVDDIAGWDDDGNPWG
jgi:hypothetical protein